MSYQLGLDRSGNNNNWTVNNMTLGVDQVVDTPTNNFATLNPLEGEADPGVFSEGNLKLTSTNANDGGSRSSLGMNSGKWYFEFSVSAISGTIPSFIGVASEDVSLSSWNNGTFVAYESESGNKRIDTTGSSYGAVFGVGDIVGVAVDMDALDVTFYKNNSTQGTLTDCLTAGKTYFAYTGDSSNSRSATSAINFGQDSSFAGAKTAQGNADSGGVGDFYYAPPSGYKALCTKNLPSVDVIPSENFNTVLWTGTTGYDRDITGIGFDPSLVWIKSRTDTYEFLWFDKVRGAGERLMTHNTNAESTNASTLNAFITDGFTLGSGSGVDLSVNGNTSKTYASWNWKGPSGSGSSNTDGTLTSTVSANVAAGFSIASYTGSGSATSFGHGLSSAPEMVVIKNRDAADNWVVFHLSLSSSSAPAPYILLTNAAAVTGSSRRFRYGDDNDGVVPDSTKVYIGSNEEVNTSNEKYIAYCFHSVDGYSKFGRYDGNAGSNEVDGTFVFTGFRPAFVMCKLTTSAGESWLIKDNKRSPFNPADEFIYANLSNAEATGATTTALLRDIDLLSNGFKFKGWSTELNGDGEDYIYMAFAETPLKYANAR